MLSWEHIYYYSYQANKLSALQGSEQTKRVVYFLRVVLSAPYVKAPSSIVLIIQFRVIHF